jgi:hypothetical protein
MTERGEKPAKRDALIEQLRKKYRDGTLGEILIPDNPELGRLETDVLPPAVRRRRTDPSDGSDAT